MRCSAREFRARSHCRSRRRPGGSTGCGPAVARGLRERRPSSAQQRLIGRRRRLRQRPSEQALEEKFAHDRALLEVVPRIGAVEGFVEQREIGDDVALDHRFEQRPLEPGRIAQMAARRPRPRVEPHPDEDVAAKTFDERGAFPGFLRPEISARISPSGRRSRICSISGSDALISSKRTQTRASTSPSVEAPSSKDSSE